jgi:hypothetical protein
LQSENVGQVHDAERLVAKEGANTRCDAADCGENAVVRVESDQRSIKFAGDCRTDWMAVVLALNDRHPSSEPQDDVDSLIPAPRGQVNLVSLLSK